MRLMTLLAFLPDNAIPVLMVLAGLALVLQMPKLAMSLFTFSMMMILLPVFLEPFLDFLPAWALTGLLILFWLSVPFTIIYLIIGREAFAEMTGTLAADVVRFFFLVPFRVLGGILRFLRR